VFLSVCVTTKTTAGQSLIQNGAKIKICAGRDAGRDAGRGAGRAGRHGKRVVKVLILLIAISAGRRGRREREGDHRGTHHLPAAEPHAALGRHVTDDRVKDEA